MILAIASARTLWVAVGAFACLCLWAIWIAHHPPVEERERPERAEPVDLAAEWDAYLTERVCHEKAVERKQAA